MAFCIKCGKEVSDGSDLCQNCAGINATHENNAHIGGQAVANNPNKIVSLVCFALAALVLILSFVAFVKMMGGAGELADLCSVAGDTIHEAYYNECGAVYGGLALFVMSFGLTASGLLAYLGFNNLNKH